MSARIDRRGLIAITLQAGAVAAFELRSAELLAAGRASTTGNTSMTALSFESLYTTSVSSTSLTGEAADRVAIRELIDAWAHCADRRLAEKQVALLTNDGVIEVYDGDPATHKPIAVQRGRQELLAALGVLNTFVATTHFNGQSAVAVHGDHAIGESYCLAHQLSEKDGKRTLQVLSIRYHDRFVREHDRWLFAERRLIIDWSDTRDLVA